MSSKVFNMVGGGGGGSGVIQLSSIAITTPPVKTTYQYGEVFSPSGMVVTATYSNGATLTATGYTYVPSVGLTHSDSSVTVIYTEGGVSKSAEQSITVTPVLSSIAITTPPTKTTYEYGDAFVKTGMVVTATYSNGTTVNVSNSITYTPTSFTSVGSKTVTVSYAEGGITKTANQAVTVTRQKVAIPTQSGTLTYTGYSQSPSWNGYDTAKMTISGTTSGTTAGSYNAKFTPAANYMWTDSTTTTKTVAWSIAKAAGSLTIDTSAVSLTSVGATATKTVTRLGNGTISASSSNTSAATVSVSGTTVTVTAVATGNATITVSVAAGTNYTAPADKSFSVTVVTVKSFAESTWDEIIEACQNDDIPSGWSVGDTKTMTIGGSDISIRITGKSHDTYYGTTTYAPLTFETVDCAGTGGMNTTATNSGGYSGSTMHTLYLVTFYNSMPTSVKSAIREVTKKASIGGGSSTLNSIACKLFLPSLSEVYGGSPLEANGEGTKYDYYVAGNSGVKHNLSNQQTDWWTRSPDILANSTTGFLFLKANGSGMDTSEANVQKGISFMFCF